MNRIQEVSCCAIIASILLAGSGRAAEVEFGYQGTVTAVDAGFAASLPADSGIEVGAPIWVSYSFESTTPDTDPDPALGHYPGAIQGWTLYVGSYVFTHDPGSSINEISVLSDAFSTVYQALDGVVATPSIPGQSALESDVFFVGLAPLPDDSLPLAQPDPLNPAWGQSDGGLFDDQATSLIAIDITAVCSGTCKPPFGAGGEAVPISGTPWLALLLLLAGAWLSRRRREAGPAGC